MSIIKKISIESADKFFLENKQWGSDAYNIPVYAQIAYDEDGITVRFTVGESNPQCDKKKHFEQVCLDSCVEFFVNFMPEKSDYYMNFEVNAAGAMNVSYRLDRHHSTRLLLEEVESFRITPVIAEDHWTVTYKIGYDFIKKYYSGFDINSAEYVKCNIYKCGGLTAMRHFLTYFKIGTEKPDFHRPEYFGRVDIEA